MDLDSKAYSKLIHAHNSVGGSEEYIRIIVAILPLAERHDHETPEMWCSQLSSQSTPHSEKDKLASVSYDIDGNFTASYENYAQSKAKNTMPNASNFEPAYISPTRQETILPTSYQSSSPSQRRSEQGITSEIFISSRYAKQNNLLPSIIHAAQIILGCHNYNLDAIIHSVYI
ncbi:unnamed protein product [Rhizophagus irregularis]|nr:unnamed protein product [Rhizophagus irregularis]